MKFFENLKKRLQGQKGMSGVIVALLLVVIGVGLVAGINTFMQGKVTDVQNAADTAIDTAITSSTGTGTGGN